MSNSNLSGTFVMLCDWHGRCIWASDLELPVEIGEPVWKHLTAKSQERFKDCIGRVVAVREYQHLEVVARRGDNYRAWLWPLDSPEVAVCILGLRVPGKFNDLTDRERAILELLAQGIDVRTIAERIELSISTVHTHLKHAREKLGLPGIDALISFAARYCYPVGRPLNAQHGEAG